MKRSAHKTRSPRRSAKATDSDTDAVRDTLARALSVLEAAWGVPRRSRRRTTVLDALVGAILSQNTTDHNRDMARRALAQRFRTTEALARASARQIERAVRPAGLARQRAATIKRVLRWSKRVFGRHTLEPIRDLPTDEALRRLASVKGVGVKTAAVVMLFECGHDVMPVDTHIARVARRLGLASETATPERVFRLLAPATARGRSYRVHVSLIRFGREICHKRGPACSACPLWDQCVWPDKGPPR